jgi:hypothetical protein
MAVTDTLPDRLLRLPLWFGMGEDAAETAAEALLQAVRVDASV